MIALLIDSLDDGRASARWRCGRYAAGKPVVALKIGGSEAGAAAAVAHSSRLAGDDAAYHALFEASGVATLSNAGRLDDRRAPCWTGTAGVRVRWVSLSTSGAGASLIADRCEALGVPLAALAEERSPPIDAQKMFSRVGNPLDMGIFGGMRRSGDVPTLLMQDPGVSVVPGTGALDEPMAGRPYRAAMGAAREARARPLLMVTPGGLPDAERETYVRAAWTCSPRRTSCWRASARC